MHLLAMISSSEPEVAIQMHTSRKRRGGLENNKLVGLLLLLLLDSPCVCFLWQVYNSRRHVYIYCIPLVDWGRGRPVWQNEKKKRPTAYPGLSVISPFPRIIGALLYCPAFFFPFPPFFSIQATTKKIFLFAQQEKKRRNSARALLNLK